MKLNVLLVCYNQSEFIEECVTSVLKQKTDFDFNIIVADDCSTDDTIEKIRRLDESSPVEFIYLKSEKNLGVGYNYKRALPACDAEYIAVIEGDDFWTTPHRLQRHVDFLDEHFECAMTWNSLFQANFDAQRHELFPNPGTIGALTQSEPLQSDFSVLGARQIIAHDLGLNFSAHVYRKSALDDALLNWNEHLYFMERTVIMHLCRHAFMGFLFPAMNVYRLHPKGVSSAMSEQDGIQAQIELLKRDDKATGGVFHEEFARLIKSHRTKLEQLDGQADPEQLVLQKLSPAKRALRFAWRITPPFLLWIMKAVVPKWIMDKLYLKINPQ